MFPNTPSKYRKLFKDLAVNHPNIAANDNNKRFVVINQSAVPFASWDKSEFHNVLKVAQTKEADSHKLVMAVIMMDEDNRGSNLDFSVINGSFLLVKPTIANDYDDKLKAQTEAFVAGKEIMAWVELFFEINRKYGTLNPEACNNEGIGPVPPNNMFGWVFNFSFNCKIKTCVSADVWGDFLPFNVESNQEL